MWSLVLAAAKSLEDIEVGETSMTFNFRLLVVLSLLIGTATSQTLSTKPLPPQGSFATRSGRIITLHPSEVAFDVPADWISWYGEFHNNIHLSGEELASVREGHGAEWATEYAKVVNSVLPFRDCVAHVGGDGWGLEGGSYAAVHLRVYVTDMTQDDIKKRVSMQGLNAARKVNPQASLAPAKEQSGWQGLSLTYNLFYQDYGGTAQIDFYVRSHRAQRIVFVFMYGSTRFREAEEIAGILQSFR
jgi:hypothetical protein